MHLLSPGLARLACVLALAWPAGPLRAAEATDTCSHFIDSLPVTITTQGTWCLRKDLTTALGSGNAITIQANNVTLDCNGFKIGGLAAGPGTQAVAVRGSDARNATVRQCTIRGFWGGIFLSGGGALVEDNLLEGIRLRGAEIGGSHNLLRRNRVVDTGGCCSSAVAIWAYADVLDNLVSGVTSTTQSTGIVLQGAGTVARGNRVSGVSHSGTGESAGIRALGEAQFLTGQQGISGNHVANPSPVAGVGVRGTGAGETFCRDNQVSGWTTPFSGCHLVAGNAAP